MRVNSVFKGFFNNRLAVMAGIPMVMLAVFFTTSSFTERPGRDLRAKQMNLMIRQIGHRLLLQAGDSTSRVLPVTTTKEGTLATFVLRFENEFVFDHDSLMALTQGVLPKTQFPSGYTITVYDCSKDGIVYGFQVNMFGPDILPCRGRSQSPGCYIIEFAFPGFYKNIEQKKADVILPAEAPTSVKAVPDAGPEPEELQSVDVDSREANATSGEFKTATSGYPLVNLIYSGTLVLFGVTLLIVRFGKVFKPVPVQDQNHAATKGSVPGPAALGKFLFDVKGQRLLLGSEVIPLTDKECRILELLNNSFGELIPRETLMQKVWLNEGVITGRSLDMFVSKLRRKLSNDPDLSITNVHGKGYRLEIPGTQDL